MNGDIFSRRKFLGYVGCSTCLLSMLQKHPQRQMQDEKPSALLSKTTLRAVASANKKFFGFAIDAKALRKDHIYAQLIAKECNIAVPENAFKWKVVESIEGEYAWEDADQIANFCRTNDILLRGTCLIWYKGLQKWLSFPPSLKAVEKWFEAIMPRYKDVVVSWDVINELVSDTDNGSAFNLRSGVSPEYVRDVYTLAASINNTVELAYNEYGIETSERWQQKKQKHVLKLIEYLKNKNVKIDALGIQSHLKAPFQGDRNFKATAKFIQEIRQMGLKVIVTELDINLVKQGYPSSIKEVDQMIADAYRQYMEFCLNQGVETFLTWGVSDKRSWLREYLRNKGFNQTYIRPLLYDDAYKGKLARESVLRALMAKNKPR